jgi:hypothetical protein
MDHLRPSHHYRFNSCWRTYYLGYSVFLLINRLLEGSEDERDGCPRNGGWHSNCNSALVALDAHFRRFNLQKQPPDQFQEQLHEAS